MFGFFKTKPFYKNKTRKDFIEWFSETKHWNKLNSKIINALIDKLIDDPNAFEVFVHVSGTCNLISNNYIPLSEEPGDNDIDLLFSFFALTLYNKGRMFQDKFIQGMKQTQQYNKALSELYKMSLFSFESAIKLNEFCFGAYYQLAFLRGEVIQKYNEGIDYCQKGLEKIAELESIDQSKLTLIQRSTLESISDSKNILTLALEEFKKQKNTQQRTPADGEEPPPLT